MPNYLGNSFKVAYHKVKMGWRKPFLNYIKADTGRRLKQYGLKLDDLLDPIWDKHVAEALTLIPERELVLRQRRLKRALDLDVKHEKLPQHIQDIQGDPFEPYVSHIINKMKLKEFEQYNYDIMSDDDRKAFKRLPDFESAEEEQHYFPNEAGKQDYKGLSRSTPYYG